MLSNSTNSSPGKHRPRAGDKRDVVEEGFIRLARWTHDISSSVDHIPNIERLGADLQTAVHAVWPKRHDIRYSEVHVLLTSWQEDDLGVEKEIKCLQHVFQDRYHFQVETYEIPSSKPDKSLKQRVLDFLKYDDTNTLLILYYGGHARPGSNSSGGSIWFPNRNNQSISVPSTGIQSMLEEADSDVLLLYDSCYSAAIATTGPRYDATSVTEVIAACGFEAIAAEVDKHSFTNALSQTLAEASQHFPFSVGQLHSRVLSRLKGWAPSLEMNEDGGYAEYSNGRLKYERQPRRTPIYSILCENKARRSIVLAPLPVSTNSATNSGDSSLFSGPSSGNSSQSSSKKRKRTENCDRSDSSPLSNPLSDNISQSSSQKRKRSGDRVKTPQILLAVRLDNDELDIPVWVEWIRNLPAEGKDIHIEGQYHSCSTLLLLRLPVAVWNLLPPDPAYSFIGFVTSPNLVTRQDLDNSTVANESNANGASISNLDREDHPIVSTPYEQLPDLEAHDDDDDDSFGIHSDDLAGLTPSKSSDDEDEDETWVPVHIPFPILHLGGRMDVSYWWICCQCMREINPSSWGENCPDCSHGKCDFCSQL